MIKRIVDSSLDNPFLIIVLWLMEDHPHGRRQPR